MPKQSFDTVEMNASKGSVLNGEIILGVLNHTHKCPIVINLVTLVCTNPLPDTDADADFNVLKTESPSTCDQCH